jgi:hypothetical protein
VIDDVVGQRNVKQFVLVGICSGADTAFKMASADHRVVGAVMINASGYDTSGDWNVYVMSRVWARHYWTQSLLRPNSWYRALTGRIQYRRLLIVLSRQLKNAFFRSKEVESVAKWISADVRSLIERQIRLLLIYSQGDPGLDYLRVILDQDLGPLLASGVLRREIIPRTDHTFTLLSNQEHLIRIIEDWCTTVLKGNDDLAVADDDPAGSGGTRARTRMREASIESGHNNGRN